jgi:hypothetical protein
VNIERGRRLSWHFIVLCSLFNVQCFPAFSAEWITCTNCVWVPHKNNDGDSFRCRCGTNEFTVRLIGVDSPEVSTKDKKRRLKQAAKLGVTLAEAREIGRRDAEQLRARLTAAPFTVRVRGPLPARPERRVWGMVVGA